jgi:hypothetical protein
VVADVLKVEIIGNAKTGTTGVFNSVRLPLRERFPDSLLLFEPRSSALSRLCRHEVPFSVLAKAMVNKNGMEIGYDAFTHHVLISRDPRDTLVSQLLYLPLQPHGMRVGHERLDRFIAALREKEADPASRSFRDLFELGVQLLDRDRQWTWEKYVERFEIAERLHHTYDCFALAYEDFSDNRLGPLSDYLTLDIQPVKPKVVEELNAHVIRSATHGDWRHWFVPSDIDFFRPLLASYMTTFGYDDWELEPQPSIPHDTASGYVLARRPVVEVKMARRFEKGEEWTTAAVPDAAAAEAIRVIAHDSDAARHGYRYAMLLLEGRVVPRDPHRAFDYLYRAALVGNVAAMEHVAEMYRDGSGTVADPARAARWEQEAADSRPPPVAQPSPPPPAPPRPAPRPKAPPAPPPSLPRRIARKFKQIVGRRTRTAQRTAAS